MKKLQPEMPKLRERYADDKMRQQQEMMALYKNEKINPLSGCLPILIQIPVFFALYKVLFVTIEMRHAPFFGWIQDLSAPDPTSLFNLFGLMPWTPADIPDDRRLAADHGHHHVGADAAQPAPPDPIQQKIFNWMPVIFTFMLGIFPAGSGDLLGLEQRAVDRAAVVDHEARRASRSTFSATSATPALAGKKKPAQIDRRDSHARRPRT